MVRGGVRRGPGRAAGPHREHDPPAGDAGRAARQPPGRAAPGPGRRVPPRHGRRRRQSAMEAHPGPWPRRSNTPRSSSPPTATTSGPPPRRPSSPQRVVPRLADTIAVHDEEAEQRETVRLGTLKGSVTRQISPLAEALADLGARIDALAAQSTRSSPAVRRPSHGSAPSLAAPASPHRAGPGRRPPAAPPPHRPPPLPRTRSAAPVPPGWRRPLGSRPARVTPAPGSRRPVGRATHRVTPATRSPRRPGSRAGPAGRGVDGSSTASTPPSRAPGTPGVAYGVAPHGRGQRRRPAPGRRVSTARVTAARPTTPPRTRCGFPPPEGAARHRSHPTSPWCSTSSRTTTPTTASGGSRNGPTLRRAGTGTHTPPSRATFTRSGAAKLAAKARAGRPRPNLPPPTPGQGARTSDHGRRPSRNSFGSMPVQSTAVDGSPKHVPPSRISATASPKGPPRRPRSSG